MEGVTPSLALPYCLYQKFPDVYNKVKVTRLSSRGVGKFGDFCCYSFFPSFLLLYSGWIFTFGLPFLALLEDCTVCSKIEGGLEASRNVGASRRFT